MWVDRHDRARTAPRQSHEPPWALDAEPQRRVGRRDRGLRRRLSDALAAAAVHEVAHGDDVAESGSVDDHRASVDGSGTGTRAPSRVVGGAVPEFGKEAVKLASMAAGSPQLGAAARLTAHNAAAHGVAECREVEREHAERHMQAAHGVTNVLSGTPCIRDAEDIYDFDRYYSRSGAAQGHPNGPQRSLAPRVHNASQSSDLLVARGGRTAGSVVGANESDGYYFDRFRKMGGGTPLLNPTGEVVADLRSGDHDLITSTRAAPVAGRTGTATRATPSGRGRAPSTNEFMHSRLASEGQLAHGKLLGVAGGNASRTSLADREILQEEVRDLRAKLLKAERRIETLEALLLRQ